MADIGSLVVKIAADASELTKALGEIQQGGDKSAAGIARAGKLMGAAFIAAASAAVYMTVQAGKAAEELDQLSHITGISTDTLQDYEVAMNRVGLSGKDMQLMFKTLSKNLEEAQSGTGEAADRFRQLGIDITKVTSTDDLIRKVMNSISQFKDGTEKAAIVSALLGKAGLSWIPAMKDGAKALDEAAQKSKEMGELSQDQIAALAAMDDAFDDLAMATKFFAGNLGALLAPALQFAAEMLTNFLSLMNAGVKAMREFLGMTTQAPAGATGGGKEPPKLVDSGKAMAARQSAVDAAYKSSEQQFAAAKSIGDAELAYFAAQQEQKKALFQKTDLEIAKHNEEVQKATSKNTIDNLEAQIENYKLYAEKKKASFGTDEKSIKAANDFAQESALKLAQFETQLEVARTESLTKATHAQTQVKVAAQAEIVQGYDDEIKRYEALDEIQGQYYQNASIFEDAAGAARRVRLGLIDAQMEKEKYLAQQQIKDAEKLADTLEAIDNRANARRMAAIKEFPDFWDQQMNAIKNSNSFAIGSMLSTWENAIATMIVKGGDLKQAIDSTMIAIVQGFINVGVQALVTAATTTSANAAAAGASAGFWAAAGATISGVLGTIQAAAIALWTEGLLPLFTAIGDAIMAFLEATADALAATGFGTPAAVAIMVGVVAIAAALGAMAAIMLGDGGVVTGPTLAMVGERGPEAVIPLDRMGDMGAGGVKTIVVPVYLKGREIARAVVEDVPDALRKIGVAAYGSA